MRRRSVRQRVQKKSETVAQLFLAEAERLEYALLDALLVNSNAAGTQFGAVQDEVVAFRTHREAHFVRSVFELRHVFLDDPGEGMLRAGDAFVGRTPFKQRESGDPQKFPAVFWDQLKLLGE